MQFILGFSSEHPPLGHVALALLRFVEAAFLKVDEPNLRSNTDVGAVAFGLVEAFYTGEDIHAATGIVLMEKDKAGQVTTTEYRTASWVHRPWGLSLPACGSCQGGRRGVTARPGENGGYRFVCSCKAKTGYMDRPADVVEVPLKAWPGMYKTPFPHAHYAGLMWTE